MSASDIKRFSLSYKYAPPSFTLLVDDIFVSTDDSNIATVTVTVAAVNDVPVAAAVSASTNEDTAKDITLSATDVEGSSLTYSVVATNNAATRRLVVSEPRLTSRLPLARCRRS